VELVRYGYWPSELMTTFYGAPNYGYDNFGNAVVTGNLIANGAGLTNLSVTYFTNFVSGLVQTNTGTKTITWKIPVVVSSPATTLGNAEVDAQLQLPAGGAFTSICDVSIAGGATSIIATNRGTLVFDVPPGWGFQVTNTVSGTGYVAALDAAKTNQVTFHP
jgi:hypothetical protein